VLTENDQRNINQLMDNFCQFMDNAGFTPEQITWAMVQVAREAYKIELIKSK